jgi:hypothetical protein
MDQVGPPFGSRAEYRTGFSDQRCGRETPTRHAGGPQRASLLNANEFGPKDRYAGWHM